MKKQPKKTAKKRTPKQRTCGEILNDIHEFEPVTLADALRVIEWLEDKLEAAKTDQMKKFLEDLQRAQAPVQTPKVTDEARRLYEEQWRRAREERERRDELPMVIPCWTRPWYPSYPLKPYC